MERIYVAIIRDLLCIAGGCLYCYILSWSGSFFLSECYCKTDAPKEKLLQESVYVLNADRCFV